MKKKHVILIMLGTLIIGILIGGTVMGIFSHKRMKLFTETPSQEIIKQKIVRMLDIDDAQLKQVEPTINNFSERTFMLMKDHKNQMFNSINALNEELKPYLNDKQKEKFDKILTKIKQK